MGEVKINFLSPALDKHAKIVNNINTGWQFTRLPDALESSKWYLPFQVGATFKYD